MAAAGDGMTLDAGDLHVAIGPSADCGAAPDAIGVDGLTHRTLPLIDRHRLGCDFLKVKFDAAMLHQGPALRDEMTTVREEAGQNQNLQLAAVLPGRHRLPRLDRMIW